MIEICFLITLGDTLILCNDKDSTYDELPIIVYEKEYKFAHLNMLKYQIEKLIELGEMESIFIPLLDEENNEVDSIKITRLMVR